MDFPSDGESDEDLRFAIALSLKHQNGIDAEASSQKSHVPNDQDESEDEDLKAAIAMSLQESKAVGDVRPESNKNAPIDLISDDEDDDLDAPVAHKGKHQLKPEVVDAKMRSDESLAVSTASPNIPPRVEHTQQHQPVQQESSRPSGLFGLNRKQMEEERLARLNQKRKREDDAEALPDNTRRQKIAVASIPTSTPSAKLVVPATQEKQQEQTTGLQYPDGVVKKTWAYGIPRDGTDIKIEEVLEKGKLELAVLSAFQIDTDWIISKLDPKTKVIWVLQAKTEAEKSNWRSQAPPNFRFCFPSMEGNINCMHSKLQLLAYPNHLRVVVPTANLTPYDWGETGVMENMCFIIDLPRLSGKSNAQKLTEFGKDLIYFVEAMGLEKAVVDSIPNFDFSKTEKFGFQHSIGGNHTREALHKTGYCGLARCVRNLNLATVEQIKVDFVTSSVGSLQETFLESIYRAAQGVGYTEVEKKTKPTKQSPALGENSKSAEDLSNRFRIYFPTHDTVSRSKGGTAAGGTICLTSKYYGAATFPQQLMRDCRSRRAGLLMHNKLLLVRGRSSWAYVGSANLSESAWGRVVIDRKTKEPRLNLRNWECGVIFPAFSSSSSAGRSGSQQQLKLKMDAGAEHDQLQGQPSWDVFKDRVPIPMLVPEDDGVGSTLEYGHDKKPWFFQG